MVRARKVDFERLRVSDCDVLDCDDRVRVRNGSKQAHYSV